MSDIDIFNRLAQYSDNPVVASFLHCIKKEGALLDCLAALAEQNAVLMGTLKMQERQIEKMEGRGVKSFVWPRKRKPF